MDSKRLVSLEAFKKAFGDESDEEMDSYDGSASEAEEDNEWLFSDERKRKAKGKESAKASRKKRPPIIDDDWTTSAKVDKLCEILVSVRDKAPTEKVIVFSQVNDLLSVLI